MSRNKFMSTSSEIALRRMPQYTFDDKSTLAQIMAWCRQATSHCFSQSQSRFISLYGVTRPLRVKVTSWWRHQMETFSASLAIWAGNSPVTGVFPAQRPVSRSFDVFFDLRLNKRLSKQLWGWWFETLSCPLWRHCNIHVLQGYFIGTGEIKRWKIVWFTKSQSSNPEQCGQTNSINPPQTIVKLAHWGRDKIAANFLTTISIAFSWMKRYKFLLRFRRSLFPMVQLTTLQYWFR